MHTQTNVNFDDARFVEILQTADAHKRRLQAALAAKGAPGPKTSAPADLGWGAGCGLPHPADWSLPAGAGARELQKLSRQARGRGAGRGWPRSPLPALPALAPLLMRRSKRRGWPVPAAARRGPLDPARTHPPPPPPQVGVDARQRALGPTLAGLQECLAYGGARGRGGGGGGERMFLCSRGRPAWLGRREALSPVPCSPPATPHARRAQASRASPRTPTTPTCWARATPRRTPPSRWGARGAV